MGAWTKIRQRFCRHKYSDSTLISYTEHGSVWFLNRCIKCGKPYSVNLAKAVIDKIIERDMERMRRAKN